MTSTWIRSGAARALLAIMAIPALAAGPVVSAEDEVRVPTEVQEVRGYLMVEGVNSRTGNYAITFAAFTSHGIPYRWTYNSNSDNRGTFGTSWGSTFDTRAVGLPDGRVAVLENGNGAITVYGTGPEEETREEMERAVAQATLHPSDAARQMINNKLTIESRYAMAAAANCGAAVLATSATGYVRLTCSGRVEFFDEDGRLTQYIDGNQGEANTVTITRSADGRITAIRDEMGHRLSFNRTGNTLTITDETNATVSYDFDAQGRNTRLAGSDMPTYSFRYNDRGKLETVRYMDGTAITIAYDYHGRVIGLNTRFGDLFAFRYNPEENQTLIVRRRGAKGPTTATLAKFID